MKQSLQGAQKRLSNTFGKKDKNSKSEVDAEVGNQEIDVGDGINLMHSQETECTINEETLATPACDDVGEDCDNMMPLQETEESLATLAHTEAPNLAVLEDQSAKHVESTSEGM